jgi:uncharacterized cupin superfamily protein
MAKRIEPQKVSAIVGTMYPPPFDQPCRARERRKLGDAAGLTQFGVNLLTLPPGAWSSQRHWHSHEDEFVFVLEGEVVLVTDSGEEILRRGEAAGFKGGDADGHCLQNRGSSPAVVLEVGSRIEADRGDYPDLDMITGIPGSGAMYLHRDGTAYTDLRRRGPEDS